ncbi:MAG TPA: PEP-utilizing enzyme [Dehalococcoidia bacterium]|nr:PEP-utilizing enzyme [Dehalococcoidia bacterium]
MAEKLCSWDNDPVETYPMYTIGNTTEVLPGITRPLYADLAAWWDYHWCVGVAEEMGVRDQIEIEPPPQFNQLGFLGGRWTVNVSFAMALTALYQTGEGSALLESFFEGDDIKSGVQADAERAAAANAVIMGKWLHPKEIVAREDPRSRESYKAMRDKNLAVLSDKALVDLVDDNTVLMGSLFEGAFYVTVGGGDFAARLEAMLDEHLPGHPPEWGTTLTSALLNVESSRPGEAIWDLSRVAKARESLAMEVSLSSVDHILARLAAPPNEDWKAFAEAYSEFMEEFGWRGQRESDPSTLGWEEAPTFVITAIQADLASPDDRDPRDREAAAAAAREVVEREVLEKISAETRDDFETHLRATQSLTREREAMKAVWARACNNHRWPVMELARRLTGAGVLEEADDVWFLRLTELRAAGEGALAADEAKAAIKSRKEEYERLWNFTLPDDVFTWPAELVPIATEVESNQSEFTALGVSPGVATGKARVILSATGVDDSHIEPGEILIAPVTDAPWTPLFIPAGAVVVEVGGLLSHAATVAREFGIPGVSGVKDATKIIKTGQTVTVDGNKGTVTIHPD